MMASQPALTSPDGSINGNPPERCPHALYSWDSTQEGDTIMMASQPALTSPGKEDWEYLEGHKELYKDAMMASQPALTSPDGSSNGNQPERCPRPLYSWESTQEDLTFSHKDINQSDCNNDVKEQIKEEHDEAGVVEEFSEGHKDPFTDIKMEQFNNRNPPERCPRPLYSRDSTQKDPTIPHHHQCEDRIHLKIEVKKEEAEMYVAGDRPSMEEVGMKTDQNDISLPIDTTDGCDVRNTLEGHLILPADCISEDKAITKDSPEVKPNTPTTHHRGYCAETSMDLSVQGESSYQSHTMTETVDTTDPSNPKESSLFHEEEVHRAENPTDNKNVPKSQQTHTGERPYSCSECGKCFTEQGKLLIHQRSHARERPFSCSECGKCFSVKGNLLVHERTHTGERPHSCSECGKCFTQKAALLEHQRLHTGEQPFLCSECGKCFIRKVSLLIHQRSHTGERPYPCLGCEKSFTNKRDHIKHQRSHTGKHPYSCLECGKCFTQELALVMHQRSHMGEPVYSCSECGKCFTCTGNLNRHQKVHTGERPYSCAECGKSFTQKVDFAKHQRIHTGENPYSCSECGKCFTQKITLLTHQRSHTGERPYPCSECGKSFTCTGNLVRHKRTHTGDRPYSCSDCGKCFTQKIYLLTHQRTHTGERPYSCSECGKCFTEKRLLLQHNKRHTEEPSECIQTAANVSNVSKD